MSDKNDTPDAPRQAPTGAAWKEDTRRISDRNDEARKAGRKERDDYEKRRAAKRRDEEARGDVYR